MKLTIEALYDGSMLHPKEPLPLEANTRVRITVESLPPSDVDKPVDASTSFLQVARELKIEGPPNWSRDFENWEELLLSLATPAGISLPDEATGRDALYD